MSFDSLTYARRLKAAGFTDAQAEALADANRDVLIPDLATKGNIAALRSDMSAMEQRLGARIDGVERNLGVGVGGVEQRLGARIDGVEHSLGARVDGVEQRLGARIDGVEHSLGARVDGVEQRLGARIDGVEQKVEALGLRLTIRLGVMMGAAIALLGTILRLH